MPDPLTREEAEAARAAVSTTVIQPDWQRCDVCGKTGNHEHPRAPQRPMLLGDMLDDFKLAGLAEALTLDSETAAQFIKLGNYVAPDGFAFDMLPRHVQDEMADSADRVLRRSALDDIISDVKAKAAAMSPEDRRVYLEGPDPEHEPGNPNCLCFQASCLPRREYEGD